MPRGVGHVLSKAAKNLRHLPEGRVGPSAAEDAAGEFARQPQLDDDNDHGAERADRQRLQRIRLGPRRWKPWGFRAHPDAPAEAIGLDRGIGRTAPA